MPAVICMTDLQQCKNSGFSLAIWFINMKHENSAVEILLCQRAISFISILLLTSHFQEYLLGKTFWCMKWSKILSSEYFDNNLTISGKKLKILFVHLCSYEMHKKRFHPTLYIVTAKLSKEVQFHEPSGSCPLLPEACSLSIGGSKPAQ